jgi:hypothetical protein
LQSNPYRARGHSYSNALMDGSLDGRDGLDDGIGGESKQSAKYYQGRV